MNSIIEYFPAFVDRQDCPDIWYDFTTRQELAAVPFVAEYVKDPDYGHFARDGSRALIATSPGGKHWWVVGYTKKGLDFLPEWQANVAGIPL